MRNDFRYCEQRPPIPNNVRKWVGKLTVGVRKFGLFAPEYIKLDNAKFKYYNLSQF